MRDPESGRHRIAFRIFAAMGYDRGRPKLWRLEAFTTKSQADWEAFLRALPGAPPRVVCDNDQALTNAVAARFPDADLYLCEWHLRHALERLMDKIRTEQPSTGRRSTSCCPMSRLPSRAPPSGSRSSSVLTPPASRA